MKPRSEPPGCTIRGGPAWLVILACFALGLALVIASIGVLIRAWQWAF